MHKSISTYLILLILALFALKPLIASPYLHTMHDQIQAERSVEMVRTLANGNFPARWVENLGYGFGYPLFNYYAPLPYYIASLSIVMGLNLIISTKVMIGVGFLLSGFTMYLLGKSVWGRVGGLFSAILYLLAPYHAVQLYVRGSIGELYAYALFPLIAYTLIKLPNTINRKDLVIGIIGLTGVILSHTVSIYITCLFLAIYTLTTYVYLFLKYRNRLLTFTKNLALFSGIPLGLTAFFWVPAFFELKYTNFSLQSGNDVDYTKHFISLSQLWNSPWGFGGSAPGTANDGMSFMLGKSAIVFALIAGFFSLYTIKKQKNNNKAYFILAFTSVLAISLFLMTSASVSLWQIIPNFSIIQFPWRFLTIANLALTLIAGGSIYYLSIYLKNRYSLAVLAGILTITVYNALFPLTPTTWKTKYFESQGEYRLNSQQLSSESHLRFNASKISDEFQPKGATKPKTRNEISHDGVTCFTACRISNLQFTPGVYSFSVELFSNSPVYIEKSYFPGFTVTVDNEQKEVLKNSAMQLGALVPQGSHTVKFILKDTATRRLSNYTSILTAILCFALIYHNQIVQLGNKIRRKNNK